MRVRYVYSACVVIETPDLVIVTDPWFTPGAYEGSWYQFPPLGRDPVDVIGRADLVYISHIHPDHYDPRFLRQYLARFPDARLVIGETSPPHLANRMRADGFAPQVVTTMIVGQTHVAIHATTLLGEGMDIDTALAVSHGELSVVDLNDNVFEAGLVTRLRASCPGGRPTLALLPYAGASVYPQSYDFPDDAAREAAVASKRRRFLDMYGRYLAALEPVRAMPFAGKYWLGGPLRALNPQRGIPDATEVLREFPGTSFVLADGGEAHVDLATLVPSAARTEPYDEATVARHLDALPFSGYDYEREVCPLDGRALPLLPLLRAAVQRARRAVAVESDLWLCLRPLPLRQHLTFNMRGDGEVALSPEVGHLEPRWEIALDHRHLFGLLTRLYHWNNAAIGAHYRYRRVPDRYDRATAHFLNFLHV